jgi:acyl-coenzyme A synthetase/AMP-(fatty) acid ligase
MINACENFFSKNHDSKRPAIVFFESLKSFEDPKKCITFKGLVNLSTHCQHSLKEIGLKKGDYVLLFEEPSIKLYAIILAILASGYKVLLVEPWLSVDHIDRLIESCKPQLFISNTIGRLWGMRSKAIRKIPNKSSSSSLTKNADLNEMSKKIQIEKVEPETEAMLTFTSGTSGTPKGVVRSHQYLIDSGDIVLKYLKYDQYPGMDLTIFTNLVLVNLTAGKGSLIIPSSWPKKSLKELDALKGEHFVDTLACGPAFLKRLMDNSKCTTLKSIHVGGALSDCDLFERAFLKWPEAHFDHVYGSSEAEPIAVTDAKLAVEYSRKKNFFQCLYLGANIQEAKLEFEENQLWVCGPHVSKKYLYDEVANIKNKRTDKFNNIWHNMGDRIIPDNERSGLWYQGRDFQSREDFLLEQDIYQLIKSSEAMICIKEGQKILIAGKSLKKVLRNEMQNPKLLQIKKVLFSTIYRDKRHRSRIDRNKTREKAKV